MLLRTRNITAREDRLRGGRKRSSHLNCSGIGWIWWGEFLRKWSNTASRLFLSFTPPEVANEVHLDRALTSYSNLTKSLEPASHADITAYRSWITKHAPIVESESAFLSKDSDLLCVSPSTPKSSFRSGTALETPVIVVAFGLLSTIIVFKLVPRILARLVISAMVGVASLCTLSPEVMNKPDSALDWRKAIAT